MPQLDLYQPELSTTIRRIIRWISIGLFVLGLLFILGLFALLVQGKLQTEMVLLTGLPLVIFGVIFNGHLFVLYVRQEPGSIRAVFRYLATLGFLTAAAQTARNLSPSILSALATLIQLYIAVVAQRLLSNWLVHFSGQQDEEFIPPLGWLIAKTTNLLFGLFSVIGLPRLLRTEQLPIIALPLFACLALAFWLWKIRKRQEQNFNELEETRDKPPLIYRPQG